MNNHQTNENENSSDSPETFQEKGSKGATYIIVKSPSSYKEFMSIVQAISEERDRKGSGAQVKLKELRAGNNNSRFYKAISFFETIENCIKSLDKRLIHEPDKKFREWNFRIFGKGDRQDQGIFNFGTQMDDRTGYAVKTLGLKDAVHVVHCDPDSIVILDSGCPGCADNISDHKSNV